MRNKCKSVNLQISSLTSPHTNSDKATNAIRWKQNSFRGPVKSKYFPPHGLYGLDSYDSHILITH